MEETKRCPYCGEEILSVAKKCKHCGKWLEEKKEEPKKQVLCEVCGEMIDEDALECPYCHERVVSSNDLNVCDIYDESDLEDEMEEDKLFGKEQRDDDRNYEFCPHCGKEILATAKKCKYCGEWLMKKCPCCEEWITINAKKCKHCGTWLNKFSREKYEGVPVPPVGGTSSTETDTLDEDEAMGCGFATVFVWLELAVVIIIAIVIALGELDWPWWSSIIIIVVGLLLNTLFRGLYNIIMSIAWAAIGYCLTPIILGESEAEIALRVINDDYTAYFIGAAIFGIASLLIHALRSGD